MAKTPTRGAELEPIDRLEEKLTHLVGVVDRMKADHVRALEENERLTRDLESLRGQLSTASEQLAEMATLKEERDIIRTRVTEMLGQLDALNL